MASPGLVNATSKGRRGEGKGEKWVKKKSGEKGREGEGRGGGRNTTSPVYAPK